MTPKQERKQNVLEARRKAIAKFTEQVVTAVKINRCPTCGAGLRRNLALTGWWQCEQFGADGFRKDSTKPSCSWQGFTE